MKSSETISNSNCKSESFPLVETKQDVSDTVDCYLQHAQVKLPSVSDSPVSILTN